MNKTLKNIASLMDGSPNNKSIEGKLDFDDLQCKTTGNQFKKRLTLIPITISTFALILMIILIPTFIHLNQSNNNVSTLDSIQISQKHLLKTKYVEMNYTPPATRNGDVMKINSCNEFEQYINTLSFAYLTDFEIEIDESFFDEKCVFCIEFICCSEELEPYFDGEGPYVDEVYVDNNSLIVEISIPRIGYTENINRVIFFAAFLKSEINDDFNYSYDITQRDTGEKGSSYYGVLKN